MQLARQIVHGFKDTQHLLQASRQPSPWDWLLFVARPTPLAEAWPNLDQTSASPGKLYSDISTLRSASTYLLWPAKQGEGSNLQLILQNAFPGHPEPARPYSVDVAKFSRGFKLSIHAYSIAT
jgi:hypothetical protein